MNRIDRLFALTTYLQSRRTVRASDLAAQFEVSLRTIYRDVTALSESGVPIVSLPGKGYALADGYFLPPLQLTASEATALVLGARLMAGSATPRIAAAADQAVAKLLTVIADDERHRLADMTNTIDFGTASDSTKRLDIDDERVANLRRAILERRVISLTYFGRNRAMRSERQVEPHRLSYTSGSWYLSAYCRLRQEERAFRLDRIEKLRIEPERFHPRPSPPPPARVEHKVTVRFGSEVARWVQERQHWSFSHAAHDEGALVATYRLEDLDQIASWILGWGSAAEVLSPAALRKRLRHEAEQLTAMLT